MHKFLLNIHNLIRVKEREGNLLTLYSLLQSLPWMIKFTFAACSTAVTIITLIVMVVIAEV